MILVFFLPGLMFPQSPVDFDKYFLDKTMRVDYFHIGQAKEELVTLDQVYQQGLWAGSKKNLIDGFDFGRYTVKVYDAGSGTLIYSKGFDSYFGEYQTTEAAGRGMKRTYHESALLPYPKRKIKLTIESRDRQNLSHPIFNGEIDPASMTILKKPLSSGVKVFELVKNGDPHQKVDIAFIAEGYTANEEPKLKADLERFVRVLFKLEPYKSQKNQFNIYGVFKASDDSGCDEPSHASFKNTAVNATFDSLGSERYLLTEDNRSLRDIAAHVPYDTLFIMVNHKRYGGGGIYNFYCTFTVDNQWYEYLFLHEFGHSFAGLADEYYTSSVAFNEFYPKGVEPREANITALLDPKNLKWKTMVAPGIGLPTPWEKAEFDAKDNAYQKVRQDVNEKIATMKRSGAPAAEVAKVEAESERLSKQHADWVDQFLAKSRYAGKIGAFEGAGYAAKGLYRPAVDCLMFTKGTKPFCRVCQEAVRRMIHYYSE